MPARSPLKLIQPRLDSPLPLWMIFPVIFAALYATHFTILRVPYYWDEAGYYIPAAWDFFRTGSLIPITTLTNAHPPLPSIYLALWWKISGFYPEVTRTAVLMVAALGLLAVWRLAMRLVGVPSVAIFTVLLTGLYPIWFAQSSLAHADVFAAACTLWGLVCVLPDRTSDHTADHTSNRSLRGGAVWFALGVLCKETAIAVPVTLAIINLVEAFRSSGSKDPVLRRRLLVESAWLASCIPPLAAWYAYHYAKTGFLFGNPAFLRYNAQATLDPLRILAAFGHRVLHLTAHMNLFVPVLMASAALLLPPRHNAEGQERETLSQSNLKRIFILLLVNAVLFSVLGGALLTRYLLPMYPLVLLLAVTTLYRRVPLWPVLAVFSAGAFVIGLFVNPPYGFAPEDNLAYVHLVRLHEAAIYQLNQRFKGATVLSAWPMTDELTRPELGYLKQPYEVDAIDDFSAAQIDRAAEEPWKFSTAIVFSTKYDPPRPLLTLGPRSTALDEKYFGLHHDLSPEAIARQLGGHIVWQKEDQGQWIALIRFDRILNASTNGADRLPPHAQWPIDSPRGNRFARPPLTR